MAQSAKKKTPDQNISLTTGRMGFLVSLTTGVNSLATAVALATITESVASTRGSLKREAWGWIYRSPDRRRSDY
jgi:hypothetical protein